MIINKSGIAIRMSVESLRVMGRATQGVKLINLKGDDSIAAVAKVDEGREPLDESQETQGEILKLAQLLNKYRSNIITQLMKQLFTLFLGLRLR